MSYLIIYERSFIKVPDGRIIPMVLAGDNNVTVPTYKNGRTYERRARQWSQILVRENESAALNPDILMERVEEFIPSPYGEHFKWRGKWVDDEGLISFIKNGIKKARTLEEMKAESSVPGWIQLKCSVRSGFNASVVILSKLVSTSDELEAFLSNANAFVNDHPIWNYMRIEFTQETAVPYSMKKYERARAVEEKRQNIIHSESGCYTLRNNQGYYFLKLTRNVIKCVCDPINARVFATEKEARKYLDNHRDRLCVPAATWSVVHCGFYK